jgi:hypothetical protein
MGIPHFADFCYSEQLTKNFTVKAEKYVHSWDRWEEADITTDLDIPPSQSICMPCSNHAETNCAPDVFILYINVCVTCFQ